MSSELSSDLILKDAPEVEDFKLLGPCLLHSRVGQGGMGVVYRGHHVSLGIEVAVKCLLPGLASVKSELITRFQREAHLAARVTHQNLVRVYDVGEEHGLHYLVMEYVTGETIRERVTRRGRSSVGEAVTIIHQAARGLAAAHDEGIVHRDIKPENIIVSASRKLVKVADLGLSRLQESAVDLTATMVRMGTPPYMPPEQWKSFGSVGREGDVWALGATLYYLLVGQNAFLGTVFEIERKIREQPFPDVRLVRPDLPESLVEVLRKCTEQDPEARYRHARDLEKAFDEVLRRHALEPGIDEPQGSEPGLSPSALKRNTALPPPPRSVIEKLQKSTLTRTRIGPPAAPGRSKLRMALAGLLVLALGTLAGLAWSFWPPAAGSRAIEGFEHKEVNPQGRDEYVHTATGILMVHLPGGTFWMGSREDDTNAEADEKPEHQVTLSPFLIAKYEVSQEEWVRIMGENPVLKVEDRGEKLPVYNVTWDECDAFCRRSGLSLPTEAQWEYACRAMSANAFAFGGTLGPDVANFQSRSPVPVNKYGPNAFGLFNMHGNVFEWCRDAYVKAFYRSEESRRANPECAVGQDRVLRGGSYLRGLEDCRSAAREAEEPGFRQQDVGFRPAFSLGAQ